MAEPRQSIRRTGLGRRPLAAVLAVAGMLMAMMAVVTVHAANAPVITSVTPNFGPTSGGTAVTIGGTDFTGAFSLTFGGTPAAFNVLNDGTISATAPLHGTTGAVNVVVTTPFGTSTTSSATVFNYTGGSGGSAPSVTSLSPSSGPASGGTLVTIFGGNFSGITTVRFGSIATSFVTLNSSTIQATAPAQVGPGSVYVTVTNALGTSALTSGAIYTYGPSSGPIVTGLSPNVGPASGGTSVNISGSGFVNVTSVTFGGVAASFTTLTANSIVATAPANVPGPAYVVVNTLLGSSGLVSPAIFTYGGFFPGIPTVASVSPPTGPTFGGTVVTVTGSGFTGAYSVTFGGASGSSLQVLNDNQLLVTAPPNAPGTVSVVVTNLNGSSLQTASGLFTYIGFVNVPVVTGISPSSGPTSGGTVVTITGVNLVGLENVTFGGVSASSFQGLSSTTVTAVSPAHVPGTVDVQVRTTSGTSAATSLSDFTYVGGPVVTAVSPATGPATGGTRVTISGAGFVGATSVLFGSLPGTNLIIEGNNVLTVTSPAQAAGTVDVRVVGPLGTSATNSVARFTYVGATPTATPTSAPTSTPTATPTQAPPTATPTTPPPAATATPRPTAPLPPNTGSGVAEGGLNLAWLAGSLAAFAGAGVLLRPRRKRS